METLIKSNLRDLAIAILDHPECLFSSVMYRPAPSVKQNVIAPNERNAVMYSASGHIGCALMKYALWVPYHSAGMLSADDKTGVSQSRFNRLCINVLQHFPG